ncbi:hypothetical protein EAO69_43455 [Streptomyces sp. me109]|nr:hypothetical protein EAO69_43455 [Streptomyces sp. me109]
MPEATRATGGSVRVGSGTGASAPERPGASHPHGVPAAAVGRAEPPPAAAISPARTLPGFKGIDVKLV